MSWAAHFHDRPQGLWKSCRVQVETVCSERDSNISLINWNHCTVTQISITHLSMQTFPQRVPSVWSHKFYAHIKSMHLLYPSCAGNKTKNSRMKYKPLLVKGALAIDSVGSVHHIQGLAETWQMSSTAADYQAYACTAFCKKHQVVESLI